MMQIGDKYNFRGQPERLVYLGLNWSPGGRWHQFALVESPYEVWAEITEGELGAIEKTLPPTHSGATDA